MKYGYQLYSVHTAMRENVKNTLIEIAKMGYTQVEPCGFFDSTPAEFRAWCDELGLEIPAAHFSRDITSEELFEDTVQIFKTLRCKKLVIPCKVCKTKESLDELIDYINRWQPRLAERGITLVYHNHSQEFMLNEDELFMHTELQKRTNVRFEIDVFWCHYAGVNPVYVLETLKDRVDLIHFRDGLTTRWPQEFRLLGKGTTPLDDVYKWAEKNGYDLIVETVPTEVAETELKDAKENMEYLKSL
ncbi:MAG: sugar phosphate isomerase/epimerase [Ruminococcaceae bacterium]|nr:sugar phosphate isomerase/epimerase [Oscillospiraceae bacterium]